MCECIQSFKSIWYFKCGCKDVYNVIKLNISIEFILLIKIFEFNNGNKDSIYKIKK